MNFFDINIPNDSRKVLVIPNITYSKDIEKDSFVDVIYNHIIGLNKFGNYYWNIILPSPVKKLNLDNVKQHIIEFSGNMLHMRVTFPVEIIKLLINLDYDVIYSHLPDWFMISRYTNKKIIGYSHWWELKTCNSEGGNPKFGTSNLFRNITSEIIGAYKMDACFLNTQDQKNRVIDEAKSWFNNEVVESLEKKLQVWNLGVPKDRIVKAPIDFKEKIIVFNSRPAAYKGYPKFLELISEYRKTRNDFTVWVPLLEDGQNKYDWIDNSKFSKNEYYEYIQKCTVGIQMRQSNYGWSVSSTDCMMNGTPMIFQDSDCYREIDPDGMFFKNKKELFDLLDKMLDNTKFRKDKENMAIKRSMELFDTEEKMIKILHEKLSN